METDICAVTIVISGPAFRWDGWCWDGWCWDGRGRASPAGAEIGAGLVEQSLGALFPALDAVQAVEVDGLLGVGQPRLVAVLLQRDGGQGRRQVLPVDPHVVGEHDPLQVDDVGVGGPESGSRPAVPLAFLYAVPADAELVRLVVGVERGTRAEPLVARIVVGQRVPDRRDFHRVGAL